MYGMVWVVKYRDGEENRVEGEPTNEMEPGAIVPEIVTWQILRAEAYRESIA